MKAMDKILNRLEHAIEARHEYFVLYQQRKLDIEQRDEEIRRLQRERQDLRNQVTTLQNTIHNQGESIGALQTSLKTAERVKNQLSTRIKNMREELRNG